MMMMTKEDALEPEEELDLYQEVKGLEKQLEFVELQEEYLKDEMRYLQRELLRAKEEIRRIQSVPLVIRQFNEMIDANYGIVSSTAGSNYYVRILSTLGIAQAKHKYRSSPTFAFRGRYLTT